MSASKRDFLLEIGTEPMPARFVRPTMEQLVAAVEKLLKTNRLDFTRVSGLSTPRRLAVLVEGLAARSQDLRAQVSGPPARISKNPDGSWSAAALGFCRKNNINPGALRLAAGPKEEIVVADVVSPGEDAAAVLTRELPMAIKSLEFPKTLEWEESRLRFGRPIRSFAALHGSRVIPLALAGIRSGRKAFGLAATGLKPIILKEAGGYQKALKNASVLADMGERRECLLRVLESAAREARARLDKDPELLEEALQMSEHPVAVLGRFSEDYLALPEALLMRVLKSQLKFFPLLGERGLKPLFIGVRDGISEGQDLVRDGYERVLRARLSDAAFFIKRDSERRLEERIIDLERVTYHKDLGSVGERNRRVSTLADSLAESLKASIPSVDAASAAEIARLAFADLTSEVVKEFPELQATIGAHYARREGRPEAVCVGLEEFYFPVGAGGALPSTHESSCASLAGKLDALAGHFILGEIPTGSADPFALRRAALGVLRILLERGLPLDLEDFILQALVLQPAELGEASRTAAVLDDFIWGRFSALCEELGFRADEIRSIRAGAMKNIPRAMGRLKAVRSLRGEPAFEPLAAAFKRASNILKQAGAVSQPAPERSALKEEAEFSLHDALDNLEGKVQKLIAQDRFDEGLRELVGLKSHLDRFFDNVMVLAEDRGLRQARLGLLARLTGLFRSLADLSEIQPTTL